MNTAPTLKRKVYDLALLASQAERIENPFAGLDKKNREIYLNALENGRKFNAQILGENDMSKKIKTVEEEIEHAKLSASGSATWLYCAGSVKAQEGYEDENTEYSAEGTAAHAIAERCLLNGTDAIEYVDEVIVVKGNPEFEIEVTEDMCAYVQEYVDYVESIPRTDDLMVEKRVDFSPWTIPGQFGTSDVMIVNGSHATIPDFKYGRGHRVLVEESSQSRLYGLGALEDLDMYYGIETFTIVIHQPRLGHVDELEITKEELLAWGKWCKKQAKLTLKPDAPRTPGELQCEWCKAKPDCAEHAKYALETVAEEFEESFFLLKNEDKLDVTAKVEIYKRRDLIKKFLDSIADSLHKEIEHGGEVPLHKLVEGRSIRKWKDNETVEELLKKNRKLKVDDIYTKKLKGPAPIEKLLGKDHKILEENVFKPPGKPTLVPITDKRDAIVFDAEEEFAEIENSEFDGAD